MKKLISLMKVLIFCGILAGSICGITIADGKGGHTFNTNLASHNKSVQDYLKVLKEKNAQ